MDICLSLPSSRDVKLSCPRSRPTYKNKMTLRGEAAYLWKGTLHALLRGVSCYEIFAEKVEAKIDAVNVKGLFHLTAHSTTHAHSRSEFFLLSNKRFSFLLSHHVFTPTSNSTVCFSRMLLLTLQLLRRQPRSSRRNV